ncbi:MAG TPA: hypothetical protein VF224_08315 [Aestuariivirga sp.]
MVAAHAIDWAGNESTVRFRLLQGAYFPFIFLLGAILLYLIINQYVSKPGPSPNLLEVKAIADKLSIAERVSIIRNLEGELVSEPLDSSVLKQLTIYWSASGDSTRSDALALITAQRSLRDVEAQALALNISLRKQDYAQSVRILDAVLRTRGKSQAAIFPLLGTFAANPDALPSLTDVLVANPPWRANFLIDLAKSSENANVPFQLLAMLKGTASPPQANEVRALIVRLFADRNYDRAYYVWLDNLPAQDLKKVGLVFDGGFESNSRDLLFDWTFRERKNVDVRVMSKRSSQADNALRIDFAKNSSPFSDVSQTLYLTAGNYRLEGEVKTENLQNEKGLLWKILCVNEAKQFLVATPRHNGTSDWSSFRVDFSVPEDSCVMQRLVLVLDAKSALDQNISGRIWYDNLKISNLDLIQTE